MKRFERAGAATLLVVAAVYLVASLVTGRSAASHPPADLEAADSGLDVYRAAALLVKSQGQIAVVDIRPKAQFLAYHLSGAESVPAATPRQLLRAMGSKDVALVVAASDAAASELVAGALQLDPGRQLHFAQGGAQAFYLTFELPVAAFNDKAAPFGYTTSVGKVRAFLERGSTDRPQAVLEALARLSSLDFAPTELAGKKPATAKKRKKISGGCG